MNVSVESLNLTVLVIVVGTSVAAGYGMVQDDVRWYVEQRKADRRSKEYMSEKWMRANGYSR